MKNLLKPRLKLVPGTRLISFLFIGLSVLIAAAILWAANIYYNIDTGEVVVEEIKRITGVLRATGGAIVGGTATQNPETGYVFQVVGSSKIATTTLANGYLGFQGSDTYAGFRAPSTYGTSTPKVYLLPQHGTNPPAADYVLTWQPGDQLLWKEVSGIAGAGDIAAVGDCLSGDCFRETGTASNRLWFEGTTADDFEILLTAENPTADYTITLPAQTGTVALGTSTANYVAYWTGTNTLAGEQYLSTARGGIGANSSAWNGMVRVVGGAWGAVTGTGGYAAYWSDANTVGAEPYLALSRGGTGAGLTPTAGGIVYSGSSALAISAAGTLNQILTSGGTAAPTWQNIADLITVQNGLTETGTTALTIKLGGTLTESTTISQGNYDLIFNLTGTGDFKVQDSGIDILVVSDDGKIYFKTYPLAEPGKQILREMIPILGFDLPVQTATTSYVKISRTIDAYPFSPPEPGTTRVHRFVIRYTDNLPLASTTDWRVATTTGAAFSTFTLPGRNDSTLASGWATSVTASIPTDGTDWWLEVKTPDDPSVIRIFQIFLAAYDQIQ